MEEHENLTGRTLGHHVVLELLGEGGMGRVYKARDERLGRVVALKVMRPEWAGDQESRRRFLREARAASLLNHPNILTVYAIDAEGEIDYIAMEFVEGGTLADLSRGGPLPTEQALRIAAQVADALVAAHGAGVVHRDLKPSNIMLVGEDRVKVVDFGLAKVLVPSGSGLATADVPTATGSVVGTAPYMSPEQACGQRIDGRSDLFSVGTILYELLAGRRPFDRNTAAATLAAILNAAPPPIPGLSPGVAEVLDRCLRKDVQQRFATAAELRAAIDRCRAPAGGGDRPSIAVLPFANMSGDSGDNFLCDGLAEEIINALTRIRGLRVIARTSSFALGRAALDVREVGARLGVGTVLEGSVRRSGQRVRVTVQLVTATDGGHLWSERFDRELTDILALEDEIAEAIAERLRVELKEEDRGQRRPVVDPVAHTLYLEGRHYFARGTPDAMSQAKGFFERALELDPTFALAHDSLAELYWYLGFFGAVPPREAFSQGIWHAMRALDLDDGLAETHALVGMLRKELDYNWPEVDRELARALELNRESPAVRLRFAISCLLPHGRIAEAAAEVAAMLQSDPLSLLVRWWSSTVAYLGQDLEGMLGEGRHMVALDPNHFLGHLVIGLAGIELGAHDEAVAALEKARELSGGVPITIGYLALAYGRLGRRDDALKLLEQVEAKSAETYIPPSTLALGQVGLEDWDAAFRWWDLAVEARDPVVVPIKTFPFFDPVRDDPRYRALLKKMNLS